MENTLLTSEFKIIRSLDCTNEFFLSEISNMVDIWDMEGNICCGKMRCPDVSFREIEKQFQYLWKLKKIRDC